MKESTMTLPHILCCVPLTAGINILHNLTISVRDENGDYKLLQPSSLLLYFQKSFSRQNVTKKWVLYYPKAALALEEAKRRSSTETIWWEKKAIYSTSARNVQRKKSKLFSPKFWNVSRFRCENDVWSWHDLPKMRLDKRCFLHNLSWDK